MSRPVKPVLADDVEVFRASGEAMCPICQMPYREHQEFVYPGLDYGPVKGCDGGYYHL